MKSITPKNVDQVRRMVLDALPVESHEHGAPPPPHQVVVPKSHWRALSVTTPLVVASRGVGKSFWWNVLQSKPHRELVEQVAPETRISRNTIVRPGFGVIQDLDSYPSPGVLAKLLHRGLDLRLVWKTVIVWAVIDSGRLPSELTLWADRVVWVSEHAEQVDRLLQNRDAELTEQDQYSLVVFDALDRTSSDWPTLWKWIRALLQVTLDFMGFRRLRVKVFLRTDQFDRDRVGGFPDASKLFSAMVQLRWLHTELYTLLWRLLTEHVAHGGEFREWMLHQLSEMGGAGSNKNKKSAIQQTLKRRELWFLPPETQFDAKVQENLFHQLTGPYMGDSPRKGFPYRWLVTYLEDEKGEITPRSFLTALRAAAEVVVTQSLVTNYVMPADALRQGLRVAARLRVDEISEYTWVPRVIVPLAQARLMVPCDKSKVEAIWQQNNTLERLRQEWENDSLKPPEDLSTTQPWLLPPRLSEGSFGVLKDLQDLGVVLPLGPDRIDLAEIYRVGFGVMKYGGMPPNRGESR